MSSGSLYYTPFECFPIAAQTAAGLLELEKNEVTILHKAGVELRSAMGGGEDGEEAMVPIRADGTVDTTMSQNRKWKDRCDNLLLQLTSHRIVVWKEEKVHLGDVVSHVGAEKKTATTIRQARFLSMSFLLSCCAETEWFRSPKILLNTVMGDVLLVLSSQQQRDDLLTHLQKTLSRKEWEKEAQQDLTIKKAKAMVSHKVGVDAILAKNKQRHLQAQKLTDQALAAQDAETLMKEATELVSVIHRYVATLERQESSNNSADQEETAKLVSLLQDMGMTSALSKSDFEGHVDAYYQQLARQIADVLLPKLKKSASSGGGGVMTLTDAYCLFNRARASNLLSPEDLLQAVAVMDSSKKDSTANLGLSTRTFPSGLIVLQLDEFVAENVTATLRQAAASKAYANVGIHELEAARLLQTSALLASEQLLAAEAVGALVRDECLEMTRFFANRFEEWVQLNNDDGTLTIVI